MTALRGSHQYGQNADSGTTISIGDICVLFDPSHPRTFWRLTKVEDLISSQDGQVHGAIIKTVTRSGSVSVLIQHLYPLEIRVEKDAERADDIIIN